MYGRGLVTVVSKLVMRRPACAGRRIFLVCRDLVIAVALFRALREHVHLQPNSVVSVVGLSLGRRLFILCVAR